MEKILLNFWSAHTWSGLTTSLNHTYLIMMCVRFNGNLRIVKRYFHICLRAEATGDLFVSENSLSSSVESLDKHWS